MANNNIFGLEIHFLNNQTFETRKAEIFINIEDSDEWFKPNPKTIGSYERILIWVRDLVADNSKYIFLKNCNILVKDKEIFINSLNEKRIFVKTTHKKNNYKKHIQSLKQEILYLNSMQKVGIEINEFIRLEHLEDEFYIWAMSDLLGLKEEKNE
ncbi:MSC_0621 family F1-like ATPase epsilon subunit [Mycoplasma sp. 1654_15]|uniref:MSC_0621 family F1-like ATPase epsilon subunit n=1 Tax=Mycoplasma sp. 1654_15 TaxID=2725994 RepID=UPI001449F068|nr:hypothetical protein [Mycoplasma sp. 1654_15]QJB71546.1 hypothetical protein HF996_03770 [Mycoplasma sp. 1654_15]